MSRRIDMHKHEKSQGARIVLRFVNFGVDASRYHYVALAGCCGYS